MDIAGLLDDMKERVRTRGATPLVGGGLLGSFTRGLLGLDPTPSRSIPFNNSIAKRSGS